MLFRIRRDEKDLPDYGQLEELYTALYEDIREGNILSAYALERHGLAEALAKMAFGNGLGVSVADTVSREDFSAPAGAVWRRRCRRTGWEPSGRRARSSAR